MLHVCLIQARIADWGGDEILRDSCSKFYEDLKDDFGIHLDWVRDPVEGGLQSWSVKCDEDRQSSDSVALTKNDIDFLYGSDEDDIGARY